MNVSFTVHSIPVAQPRVKATIRGGHAGVYTPATVMKGGMRVTAPIVEFKYAVVMAFKETKAGHFNGPIRVDVEAFFPRPKNRPSEIPPQAWKTGEFYRHTKKPDRDNLDKGILDALTGLAWADDKQVCSGTIEKFVCGRDDIPRVRISITEIGWTP